MRGKLLLLLPSCMQRSGCQIDIEADIHNCGKCGKCQVSWVLDNTPPDIKIFLVKGGRAAIERIRKSRPDGVIAVACEKELAEGIRSASRFPVWALRNLRVEGPCRNTVIVEKELSALLEGSECVADSPHVKT